MNIEEIEDTCYKTSSTLWHDTDRSLIDWRLVWVVDCGGDILDQEVCDAIIDTSELDDPCADSPIVRGQCCETCNQRRATTTVHIPWLNISWNVMCDATTVWRMLCGTCYVTDIVWHILSDICHVMFAMWRLLCDTDFLTLVMQRLGCDTFGVMFALPCDMWRVSRNPKREICNGNSNNQSTWSWKFLQSVRPYNLIHRPQARAHRVAVTAQASTANSWMHLCRVISVRTRS